MGKRGGQKQQLNAEIAAVLKKVDEGRKKFQTLWDELHRFSDDKSSVKLDKTREDLKRELKKLQRLRESVRALADSCDPRDVEPLTTARRLIESDMERYKVYEKEMKQRAGVVQPTDSAAVQDLRAWLHRLIAQLQACEASAQKQLDEATNRRRAAGARHDELSDKVRRNHALSASLQKVLDGVQENLVHPEESVVVEMRQHLDDIFADCSEDSLYAPSEDEYIWCFEGISAAMSAETGDMTAQQRYQQEQLAAQLPPPTVTPLEVLAEAVPHIESQQPPAEPLLDPCLKRGTLQDYFDLPLIPTQLRLQPEQSVTWQPFIPQRDVTTKKDDQMIVDIATSREAVPHNDETLIAVPPSPMPSIIPAPYPRDSLSRHNGTEPDFQATLISDIQETTLDPSPLPSVRVFAVSSESSSRIPATQSESIAAAAFRGYPQTFPASHTNSLLLPGKSSVITRLSDDALFFAATHSPCDRMRADAGAVLVRRGWRFAGGRWVRSNVAFILDSWKRVPTQPPLTSVAPSSSGLP